MDSRKEAGINQLVPSGVVGVRTSLRPGDLVHYWGWKGPDLEGAVCGKDRRQQMHVQRYCVLTMRTDPMVWPRQDCLSDRMPATARLLIIGVGEL